MLFTDAAAATFTGSRCAARAVGWGCSWSARLSRPLRLREGPTSPLLPAICAIPLSPLPGPPANTHTHPSHRRRVQQFIKAEFGATWIVFPQYEGPEDPDGAEAELGPPENAGFSMRRKGVPHVP